LEAELIENRVPVLLSSVSADEIEAGIMPDIVTQGYVDTIVCLFLESPDYVASLKSRTRHLIHIGRTDASVAQVDADNRSGAQMAARHLHSLGHRDIVLVRPREHVSDHIERVEVFCAEFISLCGAEGSIRFAECSVWNNDLAEPAVTGILSLHERLHRAPDPPGPEIPRRQDPGGCLAHGLRRHGACRIFRTAADDHRG
jgi:DNA-binding LacI/PurR family transcriptional regulator